jgi:hypothetical protein
VTRHHARLRGEAIYQALLARRITLADVHQLFLSENVVGFELKLRDGG